jgi:hypothetical protein
MANLFEIAAANPIRLVKQVVSDGFIPPFDLYQDEKCYFQKYQTTDLVTLQILSDFPDITFNIYKISDSSLALNIVPELMTTPLIGVTFSIYEIAIDWSVLDPEEYYCELIYVNEDTQDVTYQSEPISLQDAHDGTILIQYKNSENNFSVVFDTGIEFSLRVEGALKNFKPEFDDVIYNDQQRNATKLDSIPYRSFKLYIGGAAGIPDWLSDKINRALACDEKKIEGMYYEKKEGKEWEVNRPEEYEFSGLSIEVMPVDNIFLQRIKTGTDETIGGFVPMQKYKNYYNNADDITVSNIFKRLTLLEKICIIRSGDPFTLKIGTTDGGDQIGEWDITELITTLKIEYLFGGAATLYLTGIDTTIADFMIVYKQLDESPIPTGSTPNPLAGIGAGAVIIYDETADGGLEIDFNLVTGLGNSGTAWEDWAICDGRNNTKDFGGFFPVGFKAGDTDYGDTKIGTTGGFKEVTLDLTQIPAHTHDISYESIGRASGGQTTMRSAPGAQDRTTTSAGGGLAHENRPPYLVSVFVKKIA